MTKGKLIAIELKTEEDIDDRKKGILNKVEVVFAYNIKNQKNKALKIATPILEEREDYNKLMLVKPVFSDDTSEEYLNKSWGMASMILDNYLNSGRNVAFLTDNKLDKSEFRYVEERLSEKFIIEKY